MNSINWKGHLINLFVVILGITIALYLASWHEDRQNLKLEIKYLNDLATDLEYDESLLDTLLTIDSINLMKMNDILDRSATGQTMEFDGVFLDLVHFVPFTPKEVTFQTVVNAGNLEVISAYEVQNSIVFLYKQLYEGIARWDGRINDHINNYIKPYTIEGVRIQSDRISSTLLKNKAYINALVMHKNMLEQGIELRKMTLQHVKSTKQMLIKRKQRLE